MKMTLAFACIYLSIFMYNDVPFISSKLTAILFCKLTLQWAYISVSLVL